jgi:hypothetical protein
MRILCAAIVALATAGLLRGAEPLPMPTPDSKLPSYANAASNAAMQTPNWECPTCGHQGPCPHHVEKPGRCSRLWNWMFYRSSIKGNGCCEPCIQAQGPPLYAWFPCNSGCGGCGTCSAIHANGGGIGCKSCRSAKGGLWKNRCANGMCGTYKLAELCKNRRGRFLYADGSCGIPAEGFDATPPVIAPPAAGMPSAPVQSTAYKMSPEHTPQASLAAKPARPRTTTYRPEVIKQQMPVLSPDQFRKPKKP